MTKLLLVAMLGFSIMASAAPKQLCEGIAKKNNLWIADGRGAAGISKADFNTVLDKIVAVYGPIVTDHGYKLVWNRLWADGTVNSDTSTEGSNWVINAYGGLARYKGMTMDGYAVVACHELGHHLGGAPLYSGEDMSVEGQADYHVGTKCMRNVFGSDDNIKIMSTVKVDPAVVKKCTAAWVGDNQAIALCERTAVASLAVAQILQQLGGDPAISFTTPDKTVVTATNEDHPEAQCRLDTYFNSGLCTVPADTEFSTTDERTGACMNGDGMRSYCWFKP